MGVQVLNNLLTLRIGVLVFWEVEDFRYAFFIVELLI